MKQIKHDCREAFSQTIINLADKNERIVTVFNDSVSSSNLKEFEQKFPERAFNVGIAEQNMIGVAAGLANAGLLPVVCAASVFLCGRAFEQIKIDIGYSKANVKLFGISPGFAYGALGATHHSPEDIALIQAIPNINIAVPCDFNETKSAVEASIDHIGPTFMRVLRSPVASMLPVDNKFEFGQSTKLITGSDVLFIASGLMVQETFRAIKILNTRQISCGLIASTSIRPLDVNGILNESRNYKCIVTVEEGNSIGGLGSRITQTIVQQNPKIVMQIGVDDFAPTGSTEEIMRHFRIDAMGIASRVYNLLNSLKHPDLDISQLSAFNEKEFLCQFPS